MPTEPLFVRPAGKPALIIGGGPATGEALPCSLPVQVVTSALIDSVPEHAATRTL
jgi:hypothetical protein